MKVAIPTNARNAMTIENPSAVVRSSALGSPSRPATPPSNASVRSINSQAAARAGASRIPSGTIRIAPRHATAARAGRMMHSSGASRARPSAT